MSLWTLVKIIAALGVIAVMVFSGMLAYHVMVRPLGGVFSQIIPPLVQSAGGQSDQDLTDMLDSAEMPDIDPGEKTFQKAHELLALGKLPEAREKLTAIVNVFPTSSSAPAARRIVGEMNLDEILCSSHMQGKKLHVVKRGDTLLAIAAKYNTTIDCIIHLNSLLELRGIQPGDEVVVMPLEFRLLVEPRAKTISLWEGGRFIRDYNIIHLGSVPTTAQRSKIASRSAELDGKKVPPQSKTYPSAAKVIQIVKPAIQIRSWDGTGDKPAGGILLQPEDMEEISLLTRVGNEVEIR